MRGGERVREHIIVTDETAAPPMSFLSTHHVEVIRLGDGHGAFPRSPSMAMMPPPGPGTTTSLGTRDFDGVRAEGKKTTWTIPPEHYNKLAIEIVSEGWHAPELNVVVLNRHADPRSGEHPLPSGKYQPR